jgi:hypothetical protein
MNPIEVIELVRRLALVLGVDMGRALAGLFAIAPELRPYEPADPAARIIEARRQAIALARFRAPPSAEASADMAEALAELAGGERIGQARARELRTRAREALGRLMRSVEDVEPEEEKT